MVINVLYKNTDFFKNNFIYLNLFLGAWVFIAVCRLSLVTVSWGYSQVNGAQASHCSGFFCCGAQAVGEQAQWLWSTGSVAWNFPRPRVESMSPALAGAFLTNH